MSTAVRECLLRREFAAEYPGIEPGVWEIAGNVAERVLTRRVWSRAEHAAGGDRLLHDEHFDFRGGGRHSRPALRSRASDASPAN